MRQEVDLICETALAARDNVNMVRVPVIVTFARGTPVAPSTTGVARASVEEPSDSLFFGSEKAMKPVMTPSSAFLPSDSRYLDKAMATSLYS